MKERSCSRGVLCHEIDHLDGILYTDKAEKIIYPDEDGEYSEDDET